MRNDCPIEEDVLQGVYCKFMSLKRLKLLNGAVNALGVSVVVGLN